MPNHPAAPRALAALAILPLLALHACASRGGGGAEPRGPAPIRGATAVAPPAGDSAVVGDADGRTLENLFAGRFAGVSVSRADNGGIQIRIRGGSNSFHGSEEPLYVVDGTPLPAGSGGIVFVNPYDIEKIEVLKNPADVALYGVRGSNGVVRITTRRPGRR